MKITQQNFSLQHPPIPKKEFGLFDTVRVICDKAITNGKKGIVNGFENGKIIVGFDLQWQGWYKPEELELVK